MILKQSFLRLVQGSVIKKVILGSLIAINVGLLITNIVLIANSPGSSNSNFTVSENKIEGLTEYSNAIKTALPTINEQDLTKALTMQTSEATWVDSDKYYDTEDFQYYFQRDDKRYIIDLTKATPFYKNQNLGKVFVTEYSKDYKLLGVKTIDRPSDMTMTHGQISDDNFTYIMYSVANTAKVSDDTVMLKVVKYNKDLEVVATFNQTTKQAQAEKIADFNRADFELSDDGKSLAIATSKKHINGHQYGYHVLINTETMTSNLIDNSVMGHSFYVDVEYDSIVKDFVTVDLVDFTPRGIVIGNWGDNVRTSDTNIDFVRSMAISNGGAYDTVGAWYRYQYMYTTVGGLLVTDQNYITSYNRVIYQDEVNMARSIYISLIPKTFNKDYKVDKNTKVKEIQLQEYSGNTSTTQPYIVEIADGKYAAFWEEYSSNDGKKITDITKKYTNYERTMYAMFDKNGTITKKATPLNSRLSKWVQPKLNKETNAIEWFYDLSILNTDKSVTYSRNFVSIKL